MTESTAAIIRMIGIGSASFSRNCLMMLSFFLSSSLFGPYSESLFPDSAAERPSREELSDDITSSCDCRYSFITSPEKSVREEYTIKLLRR